MTYSQTIAVSLGSTKTGLTLSAQLVDTDGTPYGDPIATGFTEIGGGNYLWYHAFADGFQGGVEILSGATLLAFGAINPPAQVMG